MSDPTTLERCTDCGRVFDRHHPIEPPCECFDTFDDDDDEFYDPDEANCQTCCGEGVEECMDTDSSEGCWQRDCNGHFHMCPNCKGSGRAKDQWFW